MKTYPGVILTGGKSRRMGTDKAFLGVDGKPMFLRIAGAMKATCRDLVLVGGEKEKFSSSGLEWIPDLSANQGPLGGIYTALMKKNTDVLVAACDLPYVTDDLLRFLLSHHDSTREAITVLCSGDTIQPLLGVYSVQCLNELGLFLQQGKRKVLDFLDVSRTAFLSIESAPTPFSEKSLFNLNTPQEYFSVLHNDAS